ncbi:NifU family protein [Aciditerrimonas ferrireducens]|jgi:Fe/S biogenesis protein NfuA|uniref:NifU family protein n=1 Tax=Aciditerrimonas ferrireducens TaxID=667306 RepID=UPI002006D5D9|nr:NifU family protein [Aciditerrimonas ferrireducens]MCK4177238.1 NifU family protein [Aciditerrimonas ferrireducens]
MPENTVTAAGPVLAITEAALSVVKQARDAEADADRLALWVEVTGAQGGSYTYDIYFQATADAGPRDEVQEVGGLAVVVPARSVARLRGARLDWSDEGEGGLVIVNPNTPPASERPAPPPGDLDSDLARRVQAVLEEQINPAIAAHGGRADLVSVDGTVVYLQLGGGCQGCGLAAVTLSQGIEVALRDEIPEITEVVDVTDHASGENPYFTSSKK